MHTAITTITITIVKQQQHDNNNYEKKSISYLKKKKRRIKWFSSVNVTSLGLIALRILVWNQN